MALSINGDLTSLSAEYYISMNSTEDKNITGSLSSLTSKLMGYFANDIKYIIEFGSYKRGTLLPRKFDEYSDVDLMIIFNHHKINVNPNTYRNYLIDFCDKYYTRSAVYKSHPTVVLELIKLKYDLVPAYQTTSWSNEVKTYIPKSDTEWMVTDPHGFNKILTDKNNTNRNSIKPLIRLMKVWNAKAGYPIESFELEKEIVNTSFYFLSSLEDYFFSFISNMSRHRNTTTASTKVSALKENAEKVKQALNNNNLTQAQTWLAHILL